MLLTGYKRSETRRSSLERFWTGVGSGCWMKVFLCSGDAHGVGGEGAEFGEQGSEAVDGEVVVGAFAGGLVAGGG